MSPATPPRAEGCCGATLVETGGPGAPSTPSILIGLHGSALGPPAALPVRLIAGGPGGDLAHPNATKHSMFEHVVGGPAPCTPGLPMKSIGEIHDPRNVIATPPNHHTRPWTSYTTICPHALESPAYRPVLRLSRYSLSRNHDLGGNTRVKTFIDCLGTR